MNMVPLREVSANLLQSQESLPKTETHPARHLPAHLTHHLAILLSLRIPLPPLPLGSLASLARPPPPPLSRNVPPGPGLERYGKLHEQRHHRQPRWGAGPAAASLPSHRARRRRERRRGMLERLTVVSPWRLLPVGRRGGGPRRGGRR
ncbi:hypothetical protein LY78DRAFT_378576 [Colletotrichum sublineola]|nr:hypothetical protein LY78DRAFT_378576 [Colletotrichum sublineola]